MEKGFEGFKPNLKVNLKSGGSNVSSPQDESSAGVWILGVVIVIIVAVAMFRTLNGSLNNEISFTSFLQFLSNVPQINTDWILKFSSVSLTIVPSTWGLLAPLAEFFNTISNIVISIGSIALWFSAGIGQLFIYIIYFVKFLFA